MDRYIDDTYTILDGTLLICRNSTKEAVIPAEVKGHPIVRVGAGCSVGKETGSILVMEGIRELGAAAFVESPNLRKLELPSTLEKMEEFPYRVMAGNACEILLHRRLDKTEKELLLQNCIRLQDGRYMLSGGYASWPAFSGIFKGFGSMSPPARLEADMGRLFLGKKEQCEQLAFEGMGTVPGGSGFVRRQEIAGASIPILLKYQKTEFWDNASELCADKAWQTDEKTESDPVLLTFFRPEEMEEAEDGWRADFQIRAVWAFFPSIVTILSDNKPAYIYREMFLSGSSKRPFVRQDYEQCVFDETGKVRRDDKLYARYKLLAMLS